MSNLFWPKDVVGRGTDKTIVHAQAFDKDMVGTDDSLGKFCIGLDTLIPHQQVRFLLVSSMHLACLPSSRTIHLTLRVFHTVSRVAQNGQG
jgi:hypothetical protein